MINIHWFTESMLLKLLNKGELFRGCAGTVRIKTDKELQGQIVRKSVWVSPKSIE